MLTIVATSVSVLGALVSIFFAMSAYWDRKSSIVSSSLQALTSPDAIENRQIIGRTCRLEQLTEAEKSEFINAAFAIMWSIQRADFSRHLLKRTAIAPQEGKWLYRNLEIITKDLNTSLVLHGDGVDWEPTLSNTNEVLNDLPSAIISPWGRQIQKKNFTPLSSANGSTTPR